MMLRPRISNKWNEGSNPDFYTQDMAEEVWTNLLALHWYASIMINSSQDTMSVNFAVTGGNTFTGTYSWQEKGATIAGRMNGTIEYQRTDP
jgi:hypothetical protein